MPLRPSRLRALAPALGLAIPLAALPAAAPADTPGLSIEVRDAVVAHGTHVLATGRLAGAGAGRQVLLQQTRPDGTAAVVAAGRTAARGTYRLRGRLLRSGAVRVVERTAAAGAVASRAVPVTVVARVVSVRRRTSVLAGRRGVVTGGVRPALAGQRVELQRRTRRGWLTVDRDATNAAGRFRVARRLRSVGVELWRVRVRRTPAGVATGHRGLGTAEAYRRALASWYGPGLYGNALGCGGRLHRGTVGVAHKSLPCGTRLVLRHRGREVRARVIDRGPYVGDRELDLTQATKERLRFSGVGSVLVAVR